jgi:hypothetical protein
MRQFDKLGGAMALLPTTYSIAPASHLAGLLAITEQVRIATESPVVFGPALFWQDDKPVLWPRTINLVQGQTGVHKSRVAELFGSAVLAPGALHGDALGIEFRPIKGESYRLLYVDTERNISDQLPRAIQSLKCRAGYYLKQHPPDLNYTSLVMLPRAERFAALAEYLAYHRASFKGHLIVILDVLSDCVTNYNDAAASLELIDLLNVAINEYDVTFLAIIHENPGLATKARGHLGTEATNKASTVLQVSFVKEGGKPTSLIQLLYLKLRSAAANLTFFATFDEATLGLVRADIDAATVQKVARSMGAPRKASLTIVLALLPDLLANGPMSAGSLANTLAIQLGISNRTARDYLAELLKPGIGRVTDASGRPCQLNRKPAAKGASLLYLLEPL